MFFELATGRDVAGAGLGLVVEPPAVLKGLVFAGPVIEAVIIEPGEEEGSEPGFVGGGESATLDVATAKAFEFGFEPADQAGADAGFISDEVGDLPVPELGQQTIGEARAGPRRRF